MATRNIYITDTTDPSEDGSIDHPYDTFSDINWTTGGDNSIFDWVAAEDDVYINLKRGCVWRETLTIGTSGVSGHPVTIQAYGTGADPIINGADDVSTAGWADQGGDVWRHVIGATEPKIVIFDGTVGTIDAAPDAQNEWTYSNPNLDIYSTSDPDSQAYYTLIEASQRAYTININAKDYITIDGLNCKYSNVHYDGSIRILSSDNTIIQNCTITDSARDGIYAKACTNGTIQNNTCTDNGIVIDAGGCGIKVGGDSTDFLIDSNTTSNNTIGAGNGCGIMSSNPTTDFSCQNITIRNNTLIDEGKTGIEAISARGTILIEGNSIDGAGKLSMNANGIGVLTPNGTYTATIRRNIVTDVDDYDGVIDGFGIIADIDADNTEISYNIVFGNEGCGVRVYRATDVKILNNTIYDNGTGGTSYPAGITIRNGGANSCQNPTVKNNILFNNVKNIIVLNDGTTGADFDNNCYYPEGNDLWTWGAVTDIDTLAAWQAASSQDANSIASDPLFVDASSGDFKLNATSPCRDAGVDVSLTSDYAGRTVPKNHTPDIGAYELFARGVHKKFYNRLGLLL